MDDRNNRRGKFHTRLLHVTYDLQVCILNVSILVVLRVILDSKNEFGEPLVEGEVRQDLTKFLGLFALSFCFGCWCCFCCMGNFFRWITCCFHERTRNSVAHCWSSFVSHQQSAIERIRKKSSATCEI